MATWWDRLRGAEQGRAKPHGRPAPHGDFVFLLGADGVTEPAVLTADDYAEVAQVVDLTGYDLVGATLDTVGRALAAFQAPSGWPADPAEAFRFDFDIPIPAALNRVPGGFGLVNTGSTTYGTETYSPEQSACREIPALSAAAGLQGGNVPPFAAGPLPQYTLQAWANFRCDDIPGSTGHESVLWTLADGLDGILLSLWGIPGPGAHSWQLRLRHRAGGIEQSVWFPFPLVDGNTGWRLVTVRFDVTRPPPLQAELFVDAVPMPPLFAPMAQVPNAPPPGAPLAYGDSQYAGGLDATRLLTRWLSDVEIADSFTQCTALPAPVPLEWRMTLLIDGQPYAQRIIRPAEGRRWTDFVAPVRLLTGPHEVCFRLAMVQS